MILNLPKFFLVGPHSESMRTLKNFLSLQNNIYLPENQSAPYFANDPNYRKGIGHFYAKYQDALEQDIKGEYAPDYMFYPEKVFKRLRYLYSRDVWDLKFICVLENPYKMLLKQYHENLEQGIENLTLADALEREKLLIKNGRYQNLGLSVALYLKSALYANLLKEWFKFFPAQSLMLLGEHDLSKGGMLFERLFSFIQGDEEFDPCSLKIDLDKSDLEVHRIPLSALDQINQSIHELNDLLQEHYSPMKNEKGLLA